MKIIISPSGKLYGSENVLFDYLNQTTLKFDLIYVPKNSSFKKKLELYGQKTKGFSTVQFLYFDLLIRLLSRRVKTIYCNEAGHVNYLNLLARWFPKVNFIIHVRILEDTPRIQTTLPNLRLVSISTTIKNALAPPSILLYDGYNFNEKKEWQLPQGGILKIGIVGRVTNSKGLLLLTESFLVSCGAGVEFHFFGDIGSEFKEGNTFKLMQAQSNIHFHGFVADKKMIFPKIDILMHVNQNEPLGRIFFESLDFGMPFIGIDSGGIGEIAELISYPYVYPADNLASQIRGLSNGDLFFDREILENSRKTALVIFSNLNYTELIDSILA